MTKISSLAIGALLALSTVALARAEEPVTGVWKLSIGVNDDPCTLTLASVQPTDGPVALTGSAVIAPGSVSTSVCVHVATLPLNRYTVPALLLVPGAPTAMLLPEMLTAAPN